MWSKALQRGREIMEEGEKGKERKGKQHEGNTSKKLGMQLVSA